MKTLRVVVTLPRQLGNPSAWCMAPSEKSIAVFSSEGESSLLQLDALVSSERKPHSLGVTCCVVNEKNAEVYTSSKDGVMRKWDLGLL